ncbi:MAG: DNA repair protein RecN [Firmicutes bacterium]|nr:DNA repair protein RecN [Bacillota bacterium]
MLYSLSIKNVALIDNITVCFSDGFNVITGETGAGKSIMVDSLNLLLGDRTDRELVRTGTSAAEIEGVFCVRDKNTARVAEALDIEPDDTLIIRRTVTADGRSMIKANGRTVTLSALKRAMRYLVDIYGQHEHQTLLRKESHLELLDSYAQSGLKDALRLCGECYAEYSDIYGRLHADWGSPGERERRMDILRFQIDEIEAAGLTPGEEEELQKEKRRLANAEYISQNLQLAHEALNGEEGGACEALAVAVKALEEISRRDGSFEPLLERLRSVCYEAEDISSELDGAEDIEDPAARLEQVEDRLQLIKQLCRKYGADIAEVNGFAAAARLQLEELANAEETVRRLTAQCAEARSRLYKACAELSRLRREAATRLESELDTQLKVLGMKSAVFKVRFEDMPREETANYRADGFDEAEFMFSANLGEPLKPLVKVISGGEMSRFMLAFKSIMADSDEIETMVFDEIDTGISGKMAQVTAEKMAVIAASHQVLCVTHLPQIAAMASAHFFVSKSEDGGKAVTRTETVEGMDREREIARLAGGEVTDIAVAHAREMLKRAEEFRLQLRQG